MDLARDTGPDDTTLLEVRRLFEDNTMAVTILSQLVAC